MQKTFSFVAAVVVGLSSSLTAPPAKAAKQPRDSYTKSINPPSKIDHQDEWVRMDLACQFVIDASHFRGLLKVGDQKASKIFQAGAAPALLRQLNRRADCRRREGGSIIAEGKEKIIVGQYQITYSGYIGSEIDRNHFFPTVDLDSLSEANMAEKSPQRTKPRKRPLGLSKLRKKATTTLMH